jgi:hypothetical protein
LEGEAKPGLSGLLEVSEHPKRSEDPQDVLAFETTISELPPERSILATQQATDLVEFLELLSEPASPKSG